MDTVPLKYQNLTSGAKAQFAGGLAQGLKPLPPRETARVGPDGAASVAVARRGGA